MFLLVSVLLLSFYVQAQSVKEKGDVNFAVRIVANKLSDPWSMIIGPDHQLWVTEAKGYKVLRIDPADGKKQVLLDLNKERSFPKKENGAEKKDGGIPWPQGGLMGMALHPALLEGKPYVYLAYLYKFEGTSEKGGIGKSDTTKNKPDGFYFKTKIVRYTYDSRAAKLHKPVILCDTIPGSSDHNGGRLIISTINDKEYLFYAIGDMGAGQFANGGRKNKAQDKQSYEGKILRFNTEVDGDSNAAEQWIPNDNPFNSSRQNAVWTIGHRNPQGLDAVQINGETIFYSCEHGPYSDDEVNIIEKGKNYGHPFITGYADGNYDGLAASVSNKQDLPGQWHTSYPLINSEEKNADSIGVDYRDPVKSFNPSSKRTMVSLFNKIKDGDSKVEWASYAPSSIMVYKSAAIPGWQNSLLIPTLKGGRLLRLKLDTTGKRVTQDVFSYAQGNVRYRDVAVSADGLKLYLAVDSSMVSSGPSKENPKAVSYRGCIIELSYQPGHKETAKLNEE